MALFSRSLTEDGVDRYSHTWSVILLLALALASWLIPFSPIRASGSPSPLAPPQYTATCWTPMEFTLTYTTYANRYCAAQLNKAVKTGNPSQGLYIPMDAEILIGHDRDRADIPVEDLVGVSRADVIASNLQRETVMSDINFFVSVNVPVTLFVLAICLKLPHILWGMMSSCGSINIDQTLDTASRACTLDANSRRKLNSDLSRAAAEVAKSSRGLAMSYLIFKILTCVVIMAQIVTLGVVIMPELNRLKDMDQISGHMSATSGKAGGRMPEYWNNILILCDFKIRQLQTIQTWTTQCLFSYDPKTIAVNSVHSEDTTTPPASLTMSAMLFGYQAVVSAVLGYLVLLLLVCVVSLITWCTRLIFNTCAHPLTNSKSSLSLDLTFLVWMSQENAGPLVTQALVDNLQSGSFRATPEETYLTAEM